jgi:hypothetical protein
MLREPEADRACNFSDDAVIYDPTVQSLLSPYSSLDIRHAAAVS